MWRASTRTIPGWQPLLHELRAHAEDLSHYAMLWLATGKGSTFKTLTRPTGSTLTAARVLQRAHAQAAAAGRRALQASRRDKAEDLFTPSRDRTGVYQAPSRDRA
eukprot:8268944-Pyramimonas_sp.AAC.1